MEDTQHDSYSDTQDTQNDSYSYTNQLLVRPVIYGWSSASYNIPTKDLD
jgi:hypothetical protein